MNINYSQSNPSFTKLKSVSSSSTSKLKNPHNQHMSSSLENITTFSAFTFPKNQDNITQPIYQKQKSTQMLLTAPSVTLSTPVTPFHPSSDIDSKLKNTTLQNDRIQFDIKLEQKRKSRLDMDNKHLQSKIQYLQERKKILNKSRDNILNKQNTLHYESEIQHGELDQQISYLREQQQSLMKSKSDLETKHSNYVKTKKDYEDVINELQQTIHILKGKEHNEESMNISEINKQIYKQTKCINKLLKQQKEEKEKNEEMKKEIDELKQELNKINHKENRVKKFDYKIKCYEKLIGKLEKLNAKKENDLNRIESEKEYLGNKMDLVEMYSKDSYQRELLKKENLQNELRRRTEEIEEMISENVKLKNDLEELFHKYKDNPIIIRQRIQLLKEDNKWKLKKKYMQELSKKKFEENRNIKQQQQQRIILNKPIEKKGNDKNVENAFSNQQQNNDNHFYRRLDNSEVMKVSGKKHKKKPFVIRDINNEHRNVLPVQENKPHDYKDNQLVLPYEYPTVKYKIIQATNNDVINNQMDVVDSIPQQNKHEFIISEDLSKIVLTIEPNIDSNEHLEIDKKQIPNFDIQTYRTNNNIHEHFKHSPQLFGNEELIIPKNIEPFNNQFITDKYKQDQPHAIQSSLNFAPVEKIQGFKELLDKHENNLNNNNQIENAHLNSLETSPILQDQLDNESNNEIYKESSHRENDNQNLNILNKQNQPQINSENNIRERTPDKQKINDLQKMNLETQFDNIFYGDINKEHNQEEELENNVIYNDKEVPLPKEDTLINEQPGVNEMTSKEEDMPHHPQKFRYINKKPFTKDKNYKNESIPEKISENDSEIDEDAYNLPFSGDSAKWIHQSPKIIKKETNKNSKEDNPKKEKNLINIESNKIPSNKYRNPKNESFVPYKPEKEIVSGTSQIKKGDHKSKESDNSNPFSKEEKPIETKKVNQNNEKLNPNNEQKQQSSTSIQAENINLPRKITDVEDKVKHPYTDIIESNYERIKELTKQETDNNTKDISQNLILINEQPQVTKDDNKQLFDQHYKNNISQKQHEKIILPQGKDEKKSPIVNPKTKIPSNRKVTKDHPSKTFPQNFIIKHVEPVTSIDLQYNKHEELYEIPNEDGSQKQIDNKQTEIIENKEKLPIKYHKEDLLETKKRQNEYNKEDNFIVSPQEKLPISTTQDLKTIKDTNISPKVTNIIYDNNYPQSQLEVKPNQSYQPLITNAKEKPLQIMKKKYPFNVFPKPNNNNINQRSNKNISLPKEEFLSIKEQPFSNKSINDIPVDQEPQHLQNVNKQKPTEIKNVQSFNSEQEIMIPENIKPKYVLQKNKNTGPILPENILNENNNFKENNDRPNKENQNEIYNLTTYIVPQTNIIETRPHKGVDKEELQTLQEKDKPTMPKESQTENTFNKQNTPNLIDNNLIHPNKPSTNKLLQNKDNKIKQTNIPIQQENIPQSNKEIIKSPLTPKDAINKQFKSKSKEVKIQQKENDFAKPINNEETNNNYEFPISKNNKEEDKFRDSIIPEEKFKEKELLKKKSIPKGNLREENNKKYQPNGKLKEDIPQGKNFPENLKDLVQPQEQKIISNKEFTDKPNISKGKEYSNVHINKDQINNNELILPNEINKEENILFNNKKPINEEHIKDSLIIDENKPKAKNYVTKEDIKNITITNITNTGSDALKLNENNNYSDTLEFKDPFTPENLINEDELVIKDFLNLNKKNTNEIIDKNYPINKPISKEELQPKVILNENQPKKTPELMTTTNQPKENKPFQNFPHNNISELEKRNRNKEYQPINEHNPNDIFTPQISNDKIKSPFESNFMNEKIQKHMIPIIKETSELNDKTHDSLLPYEEKILKDQSSKKFPQKTENDKQKDIVIPKEIKDKPIKELSVQEKTLSSNSPKEIKIKGNEIKEKLIKLAPGEYKIISNEEINKLNSDDNKKESLGNLDGETKIHPEYLNNKKNENKGNLISDNSKISQNQQEIKYNKIPKEKKPNLNENNLENIVNNTPQIQKQTNQNYDEEKQIPIDNEDKRINNDLVKNNASKKEHLPTYKTINTDDISKDISSNPLIPKNQSTKVNEPLSNYIQYQQDYEKAIELNKTKESVQLSEQNKFNSKANDTKKLPEIINKEHKLLIHNETQFNQEENKNDKIGDTKFLLSNITQIENELKNIPIKKENKDITSSKFENIPKENNQLYEQTKNPILNKLEDQNQDFNKQTKEQSFNEPITNNFSLRLVESPKYTQNEPIQKEIPQFIEDTLKSIYETNKEDMFPENEIPKSSDIQIKEDKNKSREPNHNVVPSLSENKLHTNKIKNESFTKEVPCSVEDKLKNIINFYESNQKEGKQIQQDIHSPNKEILSNINSKNKSPKSDLKDLPAKIEETLKTVFNQYEGEENNKPKQISPDFENNLKEIVNKYESKTKIDINNNENSNLNRNNTKNIINKPEEFEKSNKSKISSLIENSLKHIVSNYDEEKFIKPIQENIIPSQNDNLKETENQCISKQDDVIPITKLGNKENGTKQVINPKEIKKGNNHHIDKNIDIIDKDNNILTPEDTLKRITSLKEDNIKIKKDGSNYQLSSQQDKNLDEFKTNNQVPLNETICPKEQENRWDEIPVQKEVSNTQNNNENLSDKNQDKITTQIPKKDKKNQMLNQNENTRPLEPQYQNNTIFKREPNVSSLHEPKEISTNITKVSEYNKETPKKQAKPEENNKSIKLKQVPTQLPKENDIIIPSTNETTKEIPQSEMLINNRVFVKDNYDKPFVSKESFELNEQEESKKEKSNIIPQIPDESSKQNIIRKLEKQEISALKNKDLTSKEPEKRTQPPTKDNCKNEPLRIETPSSKEKIINNKFISPTQEEKKPSTIKNIPQEEGTKIFFPITKENLIEKSLQEEDNKQKDFKTIENLKQNEKEKFNNVGDNSKNIEQIQESSIPKNIQQETDKNKDVLSQTVPVEENLIHEELIKENEILPHKEEDINKKKENKNLFLSTNQLDESEPINKKDLLLKQDNSNEQIHFKKTELNEPDIQTPENKITTKEDTIKTPSTIPNESIKENKQSQKGPFDQKETENIEQFSKEQIPINNNITIPKTAKKQFNVVETLPSNKETIQESLIDDGQNKEKQKLLTKEDSIFSTKLPENLDQEFNNRKNKFFEYLVNKVKDSGKITEPTTKEFPRKEENNKKNIIPQENLQDIDTISTVKQKGIENKESLNSPVIYKENATQSKEKLSSFDEDKTQATSKNKEIKSKVDNSISDILPRKINENTNTINEITNEENIPLTNKEPMDNLITNQITKKFEQTQDNSINNNMDKVPSQNNKKIDEISTNNNLSIILVKESLLPQTKSISLKDKEPIKKLESNNKEDKLNVKENDLNIDTPQPKTKSNQNFNGKQNKIQLPNEKETELNNIKHKEHIPLIRDSIKETQENKENTLQSNNIVPKENEFNNNERNLHKDILHSPKFSKINDKEEIINSQEINKELTIIPKEVNTKDLDLDKKTEKETTKEQDVISLKDKFKGLSKDDNEYNENVSINFPKQITSQNKDKIKSPTFSEEYAIKKSNQHNKENNVPLGETKGIENNKQIINKDDTFINKVLPLQIPQIIGNEKLNMNKELTLATQNTLINDDINQMITYENDMNKTSEIIEPNKESNIKETIAKTIPEQQIENTNEIDSQKPGLMTNDILNNPMEKKEENAFPIGEQKNCSLKNENNNEEIQVKNYVFSIKQKEDLEPKLKEGFEKLKEISKQPTTKKETHNIPKLFDKEDKITSIPKQINEKDILVKAKVVEIINDNIHENIPNEGNGNKELKKQDNFVEPTTIKDLSKCKTNKDKPIQSESITDNSKENNLQDTSIKTKAQTEPNKSNNKSTDGSKSEKKEEITGKEPQRFSKSNKNGNSPLHNDLKNNDDLIIPIKPKDNVNTKDNQIIPIIENKETLPVDIDIRNKDKINNEKTQPQHEEPLNQFDATKNKLTDLCANKTLPKQLQQTTNEDNNLNYPLHKTKIDFICEDQPNIFKPSDKEELNLNESSPKDKQIHTTNNEQNIQNEKTLLGNENIFIDKNDSQPITQKDSVTLILKDEPNNIQSMNKHMEPILTEKLTDTDLEKEEHYLNQLGKQKDLPKEINNEPHDKIKTDFEMKKSVPNNDGIKDLDTMVLSYKDSDNQFNPINEPKLHKQNDIILDNNKEKDNTLTTKQNKTPTIPVSKEKENDFVPNTPDNHTIIKESINQNNIENKNSHLNKKSNEFLISQEQKLHDDQIQPNLSKEPILETYSFYDETDKNNKQIISINKEIKDKNDDENPSNVDKLLEKTNQPTQEEILNYKDAENYIEQQENKQIIPNETKESVNPHESKEIFTEPLTSKTNQKELNIFNSDKPISNDEINKHLDFSGKDKDLFKDKNKDELFLTDTLVKSEHKDISQENNIEEPLNSKLTMKEIIPNNNETIPKVTKPIDKSDNPGKEKLFLKESNNPTQFIIPDNTQKVAFQSTEVQKENLNKILDFDIPNKSKENLLPEKSPLIETNQQNDKISSQEQPKEIEPIKELKDNKFHELPLLQTDKEMIDLKNNITTLSPAQENQYNENKLQDKIPLSEDNNKLDFSLQQDSTLSKKQQQNNDLLAQDKTQTNKNILFPDKEENKLYSKLNKGDRNLNQQDIPLRTDEKITFDKEEMKKETVLSPKTDFSLDMQVISVPKETNIEKEQGKEDLLKSQVNKDNKDSIIVEQKQTAKQNDSQLYKNKDLTNDIINKNNNTEQKEKESMTGHKLNDVNTPQNIIDNNEKNSQRTKLNQPNNSIELLIDEKDKSDNKQPIFTNKDENKNQINEPLTQEIIEQKDNSHVNNVKKESDKFSTEKPKIQEPQIINITQQNKKENMLKETFIPEQQESKSKNISPIDQINNLKGRGFPTINENESRIIPKLEDIINDDKEIQQQINPEEKVIFEHISGNRDILTYEINNKENEPTTKDNLTIEKDISKDNLILENTNKEFIESIQITKQTETESKEPTNQIDLNKKDSSNEITQTNKDVLKDLLNAFKNQTQLNQNDLPIITKPKELQTENILKSPFEETNTKEIIKGRQKEINDSINSTIPEEIIKTPNNKGDEIIQLNNITKDDKEKDDNNITKKQLKENEDKTVNEQMKSFLIDEDLLEENDVQQKPKINLIDKEPAHENNIPQQEKSKEDFIDQKLPLVISPGKDQKNIVNENELKDSFIPKEETKEPISTIENINHNNLKDDFILSETIKKVEINKNENPSDNKIKSHPQSQENSQFSKFLREEIIELKPKEQIPEFSFIQQSPSNTNLRQTNTFPDEKESKPILLFTEKEKETFIFKPEKTEQQLKEEEQDISNNKQIEPKILESNKDSSLKTPLISNGISIIPEKIFKNITKEKATSIPEKSKSDIIINHKDMNITNGNKDGLFNPKIEEIIFMDKDDIISSRKDNQKYKIKENESKNIKSLENILNTKNEDKPKKPMTIEESNLLNEPSKPETNLVHNNEEIIQGNLPTEKKSQKLLIPEEINQDNKLNLQKHPLSNEIPFISNNIERNIKSLKENVQITQPNDSKKIEERKQTDEPSDITNQYKDNDDVNNLINSDNKITEKENTHIVESSNPTETKHENNNSIIEPIISSKQSENDIKENEKVDNSKLPLLVNHKNEQNEFLKESSSFRETSPKKDLPLNTILNSKEEENKTPLVLTETQQLLNPIEKLIKEKENFIEPPFIRNKEEKININQSNLNKENLSNELTAIEKPRKSIKPSKSKDNITSTENKLKESLTDPKEKLENTFDNKKQKGNTNNSQEQISNENITIPITDTLKETTTSIQTNIPKINENNLNIIPINKKQIENENYKKLTDKEPVNKELSSPQKEDQQNVREYINKENEIKRKDKTEPQINSENIKDESSEEIKPTMYLNKEFPLTEIKNEPNFNDKTNDSNISRSNNKDKEITLISKPTIYPNEGNIKQVNQEHKLTTKNIQSRKEEKPKEIIPQKKDNKKHFHSIDNNISLNKNGIKETTIDEELNKDKDFPRITDSKKEREETLTNVPKESNIIISQNQKPELNLSDYLNLKNIEKQNQTFQDKDLIINETSKKEPFETSNIHQNEITIEPHQNEIALKEGTEIKDTPISNQNDPLIAGVPFFIQEKLKEIVRETESDKKEDSISLSRKYEEIPSNQKQVEILLIAENKLEDIPNQYKHIQDDKPFNKKLSPSFINKFEDVINQYEPSNENKIIHHLEDSKTKEETVQEKQTIEPSEKEISKKDEDKVQKTMDKHKPRKENQQIQYNVSQVIKDKIVDIVEQYSNKEITNSNPNEFSSTSKPEKTTQIHLDNKAKKPLISSENISKDEPINTIDDKKEKSKVDSTNLTLDSEKKTQSKEITIPPERLPTKELSPHLTSEENKKQSIEPLNKENLLLKDKDQQKKESFIKEGTPINIKTSVDNIKSKQNDLKEMPKLKSNIKSDKRDSNRQNEKSNEFLIPQENEITNNQNQPNLSKQSISKTSSHNETDKNKEHIIYINKEIKDKNVHSASSNVDKLSEQTNQPIHEEILNNKDAEKDIKQQENKQFIPNKTKESVNPHEIQEIFTESLTSTTNQKELNILNQDKLVLNDEINKLLDSSEKDKDLFKEKNKDEPFVSNTLLTDKPKDISQGNNAEEPLDSKFTMNETIPNNNERIPKIVQRNEDQIYDTNEIINPPIAEIEKETIYSNEPKKEIRNQEKREKEEHELLFEKPENEIPQKNNSKDYSSHKDDKQNDTVLNDKNENDINSAEKGKQISSNENPKEEEIEINNKPPKLTTDILEKPITTNQLNDEKLMTQQNKPIPEEEGSKTGEIRNTKTTMKDSFNLGTISEDKEPKNLYQSLDQQIENISSEKIIVNPQSQIDDITNIIEVKDNLNIERDNKYKDTIIPENIKIKGNSPGIGLSNPEIKPSQNEKTFKENEITEQNPITHKIMEQTLQEKYKDNIISSRETKDFPVLDDNKLWRQPNYKRSELTELNQLKESKITDKQAIKPSLTSNEIVKSEQLIKENELFNKKYKPTHGNQIVSNIEDLSKEIPEHHSTNQEKINEKDLFPTEKNKAKINNEEDSMENNTMNQKVFDNLEKNEINNRQQTNDNVSDIPKEEKKLSPNKSEKQMNDQERNNQDDNKNIKDNISTLEDKPYSLRIENGNNHEPKNISSNTNIIKHKNTFTNNNENILINNKINENEDFVNQDNIQHANQNQPNYNEEDFVQLENEKEREQQPSNKEFLNNETHQQLNNSTPEQKGLERQLSTQDNKLKQNTFNIEEFSPFSEFNYPHQKETIDDGNDEDKNIRSQKQNKNIQSQIRKFKDKYIEPKNQDQLQKRQIPSKTKTLQVGLFNIQKNSLFKIDITTFKKSKVLNTKNITNIIPKIDVPYILLNILRGTFIFIQKKLYFYSPIKNTISFLANLTDFHINGFVFLIQTKKEIVFISGKDTSNVETYSIKNKTISTLPPISQPREHCCSCLINEKIYLFMGINPTTQEEINTIEYIDINKRNKWEVWQHTMPFNFLGMNCFHSKRNEIIFVGGHSLSGEVLKMLFLFDLTNGSGIVVKYFDDLEGGLSFEHQKGYNIYLNLENKYSIIMIDDNNKLFSFNSTENCFIYNFD